MPITLRSARVFVAISALVAAVLSAAYVAFYLRGGPRIIDATSYYLEARAFAEGHLAFHLDEPVASTMGRFLVRTDAPDATRAAVLFPPGYPALLALGFLVGHPLVIGPLLAAAITFSTWALARAVVPDEPETFFTIPRLAVVFSVLCAALRYHTADTMSHGLSALCFSGALAFALGAVRAVDAGRHAFAHGLATGFFLGWLAATRPVSALALGVVLAFVLATSVRTRPRVSAPIILSAAIGCVPGLVLLAAHQHAATGDWFASSQTAYYAVSDGPAGCFRYGFGANIGCVEEHGEFVQHNLPHGYGAYAATATTLRRLKQHLLDAGNSEAFFPIFLAGFVLAWRDARLRVLSIGVLAQILAYVPFYFDGNYPGGGARFYADVLPLEHILSAFAVLRFAERAIDARAKQRRALALVALVPLGFLVRGRFEHESLRDRDGGLPMFEPSRLPKANGPAMLFVDTDHGFNLAFDPDVQGHALSSNNLMSNHWRVVRFRGDLLDLYAWQASGEPPAYRYEFPFGQPGAEPRVVSYALGIADQNVINAANLWPPIAQDGGHARLSWAKGHCTPSSTTREISIVPESPDKPASITLSLPAPFLRKQRVAPVFEFEGRGVATFSWSVNDRIVHSERVDFGGDERHQRRPPCAIEAPWMVPEDARTLLFQVIREPREPGRTDGVVAIHRFSVSHPEKH